MIVTDFPRMKARASLAGMILLLLAGAIPPQSPAQQPDTASVIRLVDTAVRARVDNVLAFTDIEHYRVYRGNDETHPVAEMTARDSYRKGAGKTYTIISQSGSGVVQKFGLQPLLENEQKINRPENVQHSWFISANYDMTLKPGGVQRVNGRDCYALTITPKHKAPQMVEGTLWVDAKYGSIVKVDGIASRSPNPFAGTTHMMREYANIEGFPMATHARAESKSMLFGRTFVVIDYSDYHLEVRGAHIGGK